MVLGCPRRLISAGHNKSHYVGPDRNLPRIHKLTVQLPGEAAWIMDMPSVAAFSASWLDFLKPIPGEQVRLRPCADDPLLHYTASCNSSRTILRTFFF